ncbi:hypothetical protein [Streptomyces sp. AP-93]|uniref:hypothetical protein n=1 Tax=Streptomyces sp. AP-93 TaxID=2929048 RepID=UPI001FAECEB1|nr:hypothetical protein [Streptomyces sp. AP-93]MCJ0869487.1 hypothetical protein [Streptomyces sp. AP-93]
MNNLTRRAGTALAVTAAALALMSPAAAAHTAPGTVSDNCDVPWINCTEGDLWLFYNSKELAVKDGMYVSAAARFWGNVNNYEGSSGYQGSTLVTYRYVFDGAANGHGQYVKNNAASVENCAAADNYRVYYNSGYGGTSQYIGAVGWGCNWVNLISALKNNNASQHFA